MNNDDDSQRLKQLDKLGQFLAQHPPSEWPDLQEALMLSLQIIERNVRNVVRQRAERN